jgi:hypothetical protein
MIERDEALALADKLLDEPMADPDDDLRTLARQLVRANERAIHYCQHRDQLAAQNDHLVKILSAIHLRIPPPNVVLEDGREMQFNDPDPMRTLRSLREIIAKIPDEIAASTSKPEAKP